MKVALVHYSCEPVAGGVERVVGDLARLLASRGHEVAVVAGEGTGEGYRVFRIPGLHSTAPEALAAQEALAARGESAGEYQALKERLTRSLIATLMPYNVILWHNILTMHFNMAATAAAWATIEAREGRGCVAWCHDSSWLTSHYRRHLGEGEPWNLLRKWDLRVKYVTPSRFRQAELASVFGVEAEAITVVPNGIDLSRACGLDARVVVWFVEAGLTGREAVLVAPGRLVPRKNLAGAARLLRALRRRMDAALVLTAEPDPHNPGSERILERLQAEFEPEFRDGAIQLAGARLGRLNPAQLASLVRLSDAVVLPSTSEGFGLVVMEAGACGVPVVASDIPPHRETGGRDCIYFDPERPERAARAVARLAASPQARLRRRMVAEYRWDAIYDRAIEPLLGAVAGGRG